EMVIIRCEQAQAGPDQSLCNITSTILSATATVSGTGSWSVMSGRAIIVDSSDPTSAVNGLTIGTASTLIWTVTYGTCVSMDSVIISSDDLPTIATANTDQSLCNSTTARL